MLLKIKILEEDGSSTSHSWKRNKQNCLSKKMSIYIGGLSLVLHHQIFLEIIQIFIKVALMFFYFNLQTNVLPLKCKCEM